MGALLLALAKTIYYHRCKSKQNGILSLSKYDPYKRLWKLVPEFLNWAKALPEYQRILKEEPKEVFKYKSPFEVYFERKPSSHTNRVMESEDLVSEELVTNAGRCNPTCKDRERRCRRAQDFRKAAHGSCCDWTLPSKNG